MNDTAELLRLDTAWNDAYRKHDRAPLAHVLADDFSAQDPSGNRVTKAMLMVDPTARAKSVIFSDQAFDIFGDTAISRGRLQVSFDDRHIDQRFLRVFAKRKGIWQAVSVSVAPVTA